MCTNKWGISEGKFLIMGKLDEVILEVDWLTNQWIQGLNCLGNLS